MSVSVATLALSALISIFTGYVGVLLSMSWQRRQDRRTLGLALLAEIKSIRRGLVQYQARMAAFSGRDLLPEEDRDQVSAILPYWRHDASVFAVSSNRIGLFSPAIAIEVIELYMHLRWLDACASSALGATGAGNGGPDAAWLKQHAREIHHVERRARLVVTMLKRETPATFLQFARGRSTGHLPSRLVLMRRLRRLKRSSA